jgi:hypothetical protein
LPLGSLPIGDFPAHYGHLRSASHPMPPSFKPTAEQHAVVDAVLGGGDLKIKAYAGAGKTSTLRLIADRLAGRRGSYLAFNKEIAQHARRGFPPNVSARTVHSLAYASVAPALTARVADDKQAFEKQVDCLMVTLHGHQKMLGRLSKRLNVQLQLHVVRLHALHAAAHGIVAVHSVPAEIAEKIDSGRREDDMESFDAEVRVRRSGEMIELITRALANAKQTTDYQQAHRDLHFLNGYAQLEHDRGLNALNRLRARVVFLEEWIVRLSSNSPSYVQSKRFRH